MGIWDNEGDSGSDDSQDRFPHLWASAATVRQARLQGIAAEIARWAARRWTFGDAPNLLGYSIMELAHSYPKRAVSYLP